MKRLTTFNILAVGLVLLGFPSLQAQHKGPGKSHMMYNPDAEITIKGTVQNVTQGGKDTMSEMPMGMGTHLTVKTAQGNTEVMIGPTKFLNNKGFTFAKGDAVEITGSKVTMHGTESLIAREVVKGGKTMTLRDKTGKPEWSGGGAVQSDPEQPKRQ